MLPRRRPLGASSLTGDAQPQWGPPGPTGAASSSRRGVFTSLISAGMGGDSLSVAAASSPRGPLPRRAVLRLAPRRLRLGGLCLDGGASSCRRGVFTSGASVVKVAPLLGVVASSPRGSLSRQGSASSYCRGVFISLTGAASASRRRDFFSGAFVPTRGGSSCRRGVFVEMFRPSPRFPVLWYTLVAVRPVACGPAL